MGSPIDWVQAYLAEKGELPSWWLELQSLGPGQLSDFQVQELAKRQAVGFRLPAAQNVKMDWWNAPPSQSGLRQWDFILEGKVQGTRDIWEVRKEQTVALAKALQCCAEQLGSPPSTMCGEVQDLWRCLLPLIQLDEEDILEASLLKSVEDEPVASLTPTEEVLPLGEDPESQGAQTSAHVSPSGQKRTLST